MCFIDAELMVQSHGVDVELSGSMMGGRRIFGYLPTYLPKLPICLPPTHTTLRFARTARVIRTVDFGGCAAVFFASPDGTG